MVLYHYCSTEVFHSIVSNREIRLSSLSLSNDSMEGQLVKHTLGEMAKKDGLDDNHIKRLLEVASGLNTVFDGLGFCLSQKHDLLSQWRGYANNAYGVSIGFSKEYLELLAQSYKGTDLSGFSLNKVVYDPLKQEELIHPTYEKIKEYINKGAFKTYSYKTVLSLKSDEEVESENNEIKKHFQSLYLSMLMFIRELFLLKSKAFEEEFEWRLVSLFGKQTDDICSFSVSSSSIKPYRAYKIKELNVDPIQKVILGPKNTTPKFVVESFLKQNGFNNAKVRFSDASYR